MLLRSFAPPDPLRCRCRGHGHAKILGQLSVARPCAMDEPAQRGAAQRGLVLGQEIIDGLHPE